MKPLARFFAGRRLSTITPALVTEYVHGRQRYRLANNTINGELTVLIRMLRLAYEHGKLARLPVLRKLTPAAPRAGFFERDQYDAVRRRLPADLQVAVGLSYAFGWRISEVLTLERRHVDLDAGTVRLDPGTTKNAEGRLVYLTPDLARLVGEQLARVHALEKQLGRIVPWGFPHLTSRKRAGQARRGFRKVWAAACTEAGVPGRLFHDFRRTAVRDMVNDGTPEKVAMMITGHKTRSVFDRYHIVRET